MKEVYIVCAVRTAVGNLNGSLSSLSAHKLGEYVIRDILEKTKIKGEDVSEVIMGQVLTASQAQNPARQASVNAGLSIKVPAVTINQVCGSGLRSVSLAYQSILCGNSSIIIAGGQESMSMAPHAAYIRSGAKMGDIKLVDTMVMDGLMDAFGNYHMGITAENIAKRFNISRHEQDELSCRSQNNAEKAQKSGKFKDEIVPITISSKKGDNIIDQDEFIKAGTSMETLAKLRPAFDKEGTVTAGNASGINDGAAVVMLMDKESANKYGLEPMGRIVGWAHAGVDPAIMGTGPIEAVKKLLNNINWKIEDLDLIEANEAFAVQAVCVNKHLGWDISKVNVNGGAIAIGHPIGASGTRILVTLLHEMKRRKANKGLATLCIGGGMGIALAIER